MLNFSGLIGTSLIAGVAVGVVVVIAVFIIDVAIIVVGAWLFVKKKNKASTQKNKRTEVCKIMSYKLQNFVVSCKNHVYTVLLSLPLLISASFPGYQLPV